MTVQTKWPGRRRRCRGFTYLGLLFAIAILGFALAAAGTLWSMNARRDREAQLLWVGQQYRNAIASYYLKGPAGVHQFPRTVDDLLEDRRGPTLLRHLRKRYADPMSANADLEFEQTADGFVVGVHSASQGRPIKQAGFAPGQEAFAGADCYCAWTFTYRPSRPAAAASSSL